MHSPYPAHCFIKTIHLGRAAKILNKNQQPSCIQPEFLKMITCFISFVHLFVSLYFYILHPVWSIQIKAKLSFHF